MLKENNLISTEFSDVRYVVYAVPNDETTHAVIPIRKLFFFYGWDNEVFWKLELLDWILILSSSFLFSQLYPVHFYQKT